MSSANREKVYFTSITHTLQVDFIPPENLPPPFNTGRLGMTMCPGRNKKDWRRDLVQDLTVLKDLETSVLVTLVRSAELGEMGLQGRFFETAGAPPFSLQTRHFPIRDKWLPPSSEELYELTLFILGELERGRKVVVHCNAGKGRAATICCAVLMATGQSYLTSKKIIQTTRKGALRNPIQKGYLMLVFHRQVQKQLNKPKG